MFGAEIRTFLRDADWDLVFLGEAPYGLKSFRRKQDRRDFPVKLEASRISNPASPKSRRRRVEVSSTGTEVEVVGVVRDLK